MKSLKPFAGKKDKALAPLTYSGDTVLTELRAHHEAVGERLDAAEFAHEMATRESIKWGELRDEAARKAHKASANTLVALKHLQTVAEKNAKRYEERVPKLKEIVEALGKTHVRLTEALAMIEVDRNLRAVTDIFAIEGFNDSTFSIETESRDIKELLYVADALIELNASPDAKLALTKG